MLQFLPTIILRHRKENIKKCSLRGLEGRSDFLFFIYPKDPLPPLTNYIALHLDAPPLSPADSDKGLYLIDATWHYAEKMSRLTPPTVQTRSLPTHFKTAYPRRQNDCPDPARGLASIEALYLAYLILGRDTTGLLDHYHWKDEFLKQHSLTTDYAQKEIQQRYEDEKSSL